MKRSGDVNVMPVKLGITGGVGSGKSFACNYLKEKGLAVVSADELARNAVLPGTPAYNKIVDYFGKDILSDDRTLNRKKLRGIITQDKKKKEILEQFVHPEVFLQMDLEFERSRKRHDPAIAVEVPLLFETGMEVFFDYVLTISVNSDVRVARVMARDQITQKEARALMKIQMPEEEKIKKSDFTIDNNGTLKETQILIDRFYENFIDKIKN
ncbi:MAG: dephospho-CoA kinase [Desulfobacteraceae bacterium]|nr:dephospho-CoA kinase [Desulfobacteraceae bacterium]MBC2754548.1 dephospho-CoA kinase [Desulfobacteraceae bacterium]MBC2763787.1 dephospho-CoA kinase [ANME-2 cluster archaeon]